jgi:hypothetical protein
VVQRGCSLRDAQTGRISVDNMVSGVECEAENETSVRDVFIYQGVCIGAGC